MNERICTVVDGVVVEVGADAGGVVGGAVLVVSLGALAVVVTGVDVLELEQAASTMRPSTTAGGARRALDMRRS